MDIESSLIAAQQGLILNPAAKPPPREVNPRQQSDNAPTEFPRTQVVARQGSEEVQVQADKYRKQQQFYDQPESRNRQAIEAYQSLARSQVREEIHQSMGIDTYV
ncbi:hypothetical protein [Bowmanella dokdonensis]|uniref:Uncharacterized protein n=1 Tax=Bowmanella dokdonensis TaxID=751969 RepID=A0A939DLM6_9ALTE|nr:hypothetical protein [Bowmanella dokdonensis]MBN7825019.1 hypothetical protein [Bowmanella dokdonensis]